MAQRIHRFGVGQTAKVLGVLYALMGVVLIPFFLVARMYAPSGAGIGMGYVILVPIVYGLIGFVFTAIACVIYNIVAGWTGGIEVEIAETTA